MSKNVDKFLNDLMNTGVPESIKRMVMSLPQEGKKALANYYDEKSEFHKYADIVKNIDHFAVNTDNSMMIYHYTTTESLKEILDSGYFRIKATDYMNDPDEFKWASKVGIKWLKNFDANKDELVAFGEMASTQLFKDSYIWSFTKNEDSQTLFNVYGNKSGVALGFDSKDIMKILASHNSNGKRDLTKFKNGDAFTFPLQVEYDTKLQEKYIFPIVEEWLYAYRTYKNDPFDMERILQRCSKNMFLFNMIFKNPILRQEEELRYVVIRIGEGQRKPEIKVEDIPYTTCPITKDFIQSVKLQTGSPYDIDQIRNLVNRYDQNSLVSLSNIPY